MFSQGVGWLLKMKRGQHLHGRPRQKIVNEQTEKARHCSKIVGLGVILHVN